MSNENHCNGIDRVDCKGGYVSEICETCCGPCNFIKGSYKLDNVKVQCKAIHKQFSNVLSEIRDDWVPSRHLEKNVNKSIMTGEMRQNKALERHEKTMSTKNSEYIKKKAAEIKQLHASKTNTTFNHKIGHNKPTKVCNIPNYNDKTVTNNIIQDRNLYECDDEVIVKKFVKKPIKVCNLSERDEVVTTKPTKKFVKKPIKVCDLSESNECDEFENVDIADKKPTKIRELSEDKYGVATNKSTKINNHKNKSTSLSTNQ
jgi:hypothetical protein